jgi:hypothetical protein
MSIWKRVVLAIVVLFAAIQFAPYGHQHTNPPVRKQPSWSSPHVASLARSACFDCHSNETRWPWYSYVAPMSWLVARDVVEGRQHLNFSEFDAPQKRAKDAAEELREGEMPPWFYLPLHAEARLGDSDRAALVDGFVATFGAKTREARGERDEE